MSQPGEVQADRVTPPEEVVELALYIHIWSIGSEGPISGKKLAHRFQTDTRGIRKLVAEARRHQLPIGSCHEGYYWPLDEKDVAITVKHITSLFAPLRTAYEGFVAGVKRELDIDLQERLF